ncbi:putative mitochondrial protein [Sesamum angolense]|uniref:Mitochondrial protein n=1 Tax=Sesamum angolense TaxID=2727404 RepID=A0AAE2BVP9_9LAMI|nr:putative mitochondrial protein [Sesamum angolense]
MALKLDISKAYDKIEWKFLEKVLFGSVIPQRGLRQGDPLSPYLFLLCTEAFSALLQREERGGRLQGVAVCRRAPRVSHLLFADDTLIFCQAKVDAALCILEVLDNFGRAAGQEINFSKSSMVFSRNTVASLRDEIQGILNIRVEGRHDLYLGLPSVVGKTRRSVFQSIRDRVWNRINGWNERNISQAGKEILIKAVAQAIPTYAMGCFRLPISLIKELQSMVANFWWHNGETRKTHWISWRKLCKSKVQGGLGFRDLQAFNLAMLSKQLWRIISKPDSLLCRVLRARYFPYGHFFRHRLDAILPTLGAVSRRPNRWCEEDSDGGFVLAAQFGFGEIPGSRAPSLFLSFLRQMLHSLICVSVTLSMPLRRSGITVSFASCFGKKISMLSSLFPQPHRWGRLSYMASYT